MAQVIKTTFQLRRGLEAAWKKNNPILSSGEPSFVIDKNYLKIGDGETHWSDLKPIGLDGGSTGGEGNTQVQSDWKETDQTLLSYIKNKPSKEDALKLVSEMGFVTPVGDPCDNLFVDEEGNQFNLI